MTKTSSRPLCSHLGHVELERKADTCAVVFDPFGAAEQFVKTVFPGGSQQSASGTL